MQHASRTKEIGESKFDKSAELKRLKDEQRKREREAGKSLSEYCSGDTALAFDRSAEPTKLEDEVKKKKQEAASMNAPYHIGNTSSAFDRLDKLEN